MLSKNNTQNNLESKARANIEMVHSLSDYFNQEVIQMANGDLTFGTHKII